MAAGQDDPLTGAACLDPNNDTQWTKVEGEGGVHRLDCLTTPATAPSSVQGGSFQVRSPPILAYSSTRPGASLRTNFTEPRRDGRGSRPGALCVRRAAAITPQAERRVASSIALVRVTGARVGTPIPEVRPGTDNTQFLGGCSLVRHPFDLCDRHGPRAAGGHEARLGAGEEHPALMVPHGPFAPPAVDPWPASGGWPTRLRPNHGEARRRSVRRSNGLQAPT